MRRVLEYQADQIEMVLTSHRVPGRVMGGVVTPRWVSYQGLETLARAAGWNWNLTYLQPLHFLVMYPVRWLPGGSQVIALDTEVSSSDSRGVGSHRTPRRAPLIRGESMSDRPSRTLSIAPGVLWS